MKTINLICLDPSLQIPNWTLGSQYNCAPIPMDLSLLLDKVLNTCEADAWLFWDPALGTPDKNLLVNLLDQSADAWHAGLKLGLAGKPEIIDFVSPTWMLNRDPDPEITATSWRLSLRACLIKTQLLKQLGGPSSEFSSLEAVGLELGYRYIRRGAFIQHTPSLDSVKPQPIQIQLPFEDQLKFIKAGFGNKWMSWAVFRALLTGITGAGTALRGFKAAHQFAPNREIDNYIHFTEPDKSEDKQARVSILIPTINRYPYLRTLLTQIRDQTVTPLEILVIDQTPEPGRDLNIAQEFSDLPLRWFNLDQAGQCSSRNFGLQYSTGDYILFIDDDDEIPPDLIEAHLNCLSEYHCNVSCGVAIETGVGSLPPDFTFIRTSDVFPTNNTMINRKVLYISGMFDLAYDHGQRADHDLGMRIYLAGEKMVLNPEIKVIHHHAPSGGLREHKARVITYASSRQSYTQRHLLSVSDVYLAMRYFSRRQVDELIWLSVLGSFSRKGSVLQITLKVITSLFLLPHSIYILARNKKLAEKMLKHFPQIPKLDDHL